MTAITRLFKRLPCFADSSWGHDDELDGALLLAGLRRGPDGGPPLLSDELRARALPRILRARATSGSCGSCASRAPPCARCSATSSEPCRARTALGLGRQIGGGQGMSRLEKACATYVASIRQTLELKERLGERIAVVDYDELVGRSRPAVAGAVPVRIGRLRRQAAAPPARQERAQRRARELGSRDRRRARVAGLPASPLAATLSLAHGVTPSANRAARDDKLDILFVTSDLYPAVSPCRESRVRRRAWQRAGIASTGCMQAAEPTSRERRAALQRRHGVRRRDERGGSTRSARLRRTSPTFATTSACSACLRRHRYSLVQIKDKYFGALLAIAGGEAAWRSGVLLARLPARRGVAVRGAAAASRATAAVPLARHAATLAAVSSHHAGLHARVRAERADAPRRRARRHPARAR